MTDFNKLIPEQPGKQPDPFGDFLNSLDMDDFSIVSSGSALTPWAYDCVQQAVEAIQSINEGNKNGAMYPLEASQGELLKAVIAHIEELLSALKGQQIDGAGFMIYAMAVFAVAWNNYIDQYAEEQEDDNDRF